MIVWLFMLGVVFIPFDGFGYGIELLRDSAWALSIYIFIPCLLIFAFKIISSLNNKEAMIDKGGARILWYAFIFLVLVSVSFALNAHAIWGGEFRGRHAIDKFFGSALQMFFNFALAYLAYFVSQYDWREVIIKPIVVSLILCAIFSIFEVGGWYNAGMAKIYDVLFKILHGDLLDRLWVSLSSKDSFMDRRLFSVSSEPSFFGYCAGVFFPWIYVAFRTNQNKLFYGALFVLLNVMLILNHSRTGMLALVGNWGMLLVISGLFYAFIHKAHGMKHIIYGAIGLSVAIAVILGAVYFDQLVYYVSQGVAALNQKSNASNVTRLGFNLAAIDMWKDNPIFGVGWGQFAFRATQYMPSWTWYNTEVMNYMTNRRFPFPEPNSVFTRLLADIGIVGLVLWLWLWVGLAYNVLKRVGGDRCVTQIQYFYAYALIANCFNILFLGLNGGSVRNPMIWITLGLACRYLYGQDCVRKRN